MTAEPRPKSTCGNCLHWRCVPHERRAFGDLAVGTCSLGGPDAVEGCSDTLACDVCPRWRGEVRDAR